MGFYEDDSDIKIAEFKEKRNVMHDQTIADHQLQTQNGNLERAKQFGALMADKVYAYENNSQEEAVALNEQMLFVFAATVAFENYTPSRMTAVSALASFYERLNGISSEFYHVISNSAAFSFYYLCLRNRPSLERSVGETFSMICGNAEDTELAQKGSRLFAEFLGEASEIAEKLNFIK